MAPPKGFIPWNKGIKGIHLSPETEFKKGQHASSNTEFKKGHKPTNPIKKGERRSVGTEFTRERVFGDKNNKWKSGGVGYGATHTWIYRNYGKATFCENGDESFIGFPCTSKSHNFEWAFINKVGHARDRDMYMQLCHSCHIKYDKRK